MDERTDGPWDAPQRKSTGRRWKAGAASALAAALLAGGGIAVALDARQPQNDAAQPAALVVPAANSTASPSPSASAPAKTQQTDRAALRRALAVVIRQDGTAQYGPHAQAAARAVANRFPAAFRRLPAKLRQDLWTLAGAPAGQEVADAQTIKKGALDGTYGSAVQKVAQAIQKAPAAPKTPKPGTSAPSTPAPSATTPSATTGS
ncbi:hypothetical protein [Sinomonas susongensis]|uniref:hypothetical protein n=1 Tax=Sinomonas susongensis TaxID=1324851 RepID=UPI00110927F0|nr:hypothetical protein [Sinomonas susongensis]